MAKNVTSGPARRKPILFEVGECLIEAGAAWPEIEEQLTHQLGVLQVEAGP